MVALRTQRQGVVVEILIDQKIGMNHNLESIRIDSTDSDSISVQIANRITMGESIRKATSPTQTSSIALSTPSRHTQDRHAQKTTRPRRHGKVAMPKGVGRTADGGFGEG